MSNRSNESREESSQEEGARRKHLYQLYLRYLAEELAEAAPRVRLGGRAAATLEKQFTPLPEAAFVEHLASMTTSDREEYERRLALGYHAGRADSIKHTARIIDARLGFSPRGDGTSGHRAG